MHGMTCVYSEIFINGTCYAHCSALCFFHALSCIFMYMYIFFLAAQQALPDLGSLTKYRTWAPGVKAPSPNHCAIREFLISYFWDPPMLLCIDLVHNWNICFCVMFLRLEIESSCAKIESGVAGGETYLKYLFCREKIVTTN